MIRRSLWTLPLVLLSLYATNLHAQAKFAIYATGGGEKSGLANQGWTTAGTFGFYYGLYHVGPLSLSADARADLSSNVKSGFLGPRLAFSIPGIPIKPYAEILVGGSTYPVLDSRIVTRIVGGIDTTILPHIDWRLIDYSYGLNQNDHAQTISTGLVVRF
jgi:hypothetical protein